MIRGLTKIIACLILVNLSLASKFAATVFVDFDKDEVQEMIKFRKNCVHDVIEIIKLLDKADFKSFKESYSKIDSLKDRRAAYNSLNGYFNDKYIADFDKKGTCDYHQRLRLSWLLETFYSDLRHVLKLSEEEKPELDGLNPYDLIVNLRKELAEIIELPAEMLPKDIRFAVNEEGKEDSKKEFVVDNRNEVNCNIQVAQELTKKSNGNLDLTVRDTYWGFWTMQPDNTDAVATNKLNLLDVQWTVRQENNFSVIGDFSDNKATKVPFSTGVMQELYELKSCTITFTGKETDKYDAELNLHVRVCKDCKKE